MTNRIPIAFPRGVFLALLLALSLIIAMPSAASDDSNDDGGPNDPGPLGPIALPGPDIGDIGPQVPIVELDLSHLLCVGAQVVAGATLEEALEVCGIC